MRYLFAFILFVIFTSVTFDAAFAEGEKDVAELVRDLDNRLEERREQAKIELIKKGSEAKAELLKALKKGSSRTRQAAAEILARMGEKEVLPVLLEAVRGKDSFRRRSAAIALGYLPSEESVKELAAITGKYDDVELSRIASRALMRIAKSEEFRPLVIKAVIYELKRPVEIQSDILRRILVDIGADSIPFLVEALASSTLQCERMRMALTILGKPAQKALLEALKNENNNIRQNAALALGEMGDTQVVPELIKYLKAADKEAWVRVALCLALGKLEQPDAVPALLLFIDDSSPYVREAACFALGLIKSKDASNELIRKLKDSVIFVRYAAVMALGEIKDPKALAPVMRLAADESPSVQQAVAWTLGEYGDTKAVSTLLKLKVNEQYLVRLSAAKSLCQLGNAEGENLLILGLNHPLGSLRRLSAYYAVFIRDKRVIAPLIKLLEDDYPMTSQIAEYTLRKLTGIKDFERDRKKWEAWWKENAPTFIIKPEEDAKVFVEAIILEQMGEEDEAIKKWNDLISKYPNDPEHKRRLAEIYAQAKNERNFNPHLAIKLAEEAVKQNDGSDYLKTLAIAYNSNGEYSKAIETIKKAIDKRSPVPKEYKDLLQKFEKAMALEGSR